MSTHHDYSRVYAVYNSLTPKPNELISDNDRYYVREGRLDVWDDKKRKKSKRYIFLFNDVLLITKKDGSKKYWLRIYVNLNPHTVEIQDSDPFQFRLQCRNRVFHFFSDTPVQLWVEDITRCLKGKKVKKERREKKKKDRSKESRHRTSSSPSFENTVVERPSHQQSFSSREFSDAFDNEVKFDSGVKLSGIKPMNANDMTNAVPTLAPPPGSSISTSHHTHQHPHTSTVPNIEAPIQEPPKSSNISEDLLSLDFSDNRASQQMQPQTVQSSNPFLDPSSQVQESSYQTIGSYQQTPQQQYQMQQPIQPQQQQPFQPQQQQPFQSQQQPFQPQKQSYQSQQQPFQPQQQQPFQPQQQQPFQPQQQQPFQSQQSYQSQPLHQNPFQSEQQPQQPQQPSFLL